MSSSKLITSADEIPHAPLYVTAVDRIMSGWGRSLRKTNLVICPCVDGTEANYVFDQLEKREEMRDVLMSACKPHFARNFTYSLFDRESARLWYPQAQEG